MLINVLIQYIAFCSSAGNDLMNGAQVSFCCLRTRERSFGIAVAGGKFVPLIKRGKYVDAEVAQQRDATFRILCN